MCPPSNYRPSSFTATWTLEGPKVYIEGGIYSAVLTSNQRSSQISWKPKSQKYMFGGYNLVGGDGGPSGHSVTEVETCKGAEIGVGAFPYASRVQARFLADWPHHTFSVPSAVVQAHEPPSASGCKHHQSSVTITVALERYHLFVFMVICVTFFLYPHSLADGLFLTIRNGPTNSVL